MKKEEVIPPFKIWRFFKKYESKVKYPICCSDCQSFIQKEVLEMADEEII